MSAPHGRILAAARELFCRDGIHATGIDRILATAGASKMTLYARLGAVLREEGRLQRAHLFGEMARAGTDPGAQLRAVVPAMQSWFAGDRFYGCALMNAAAEHTKGEAWLRALAAEHHREILGAFRVRAEAAGYPDAAVLARQMLLLMDGMIAATMVSGDPAIIAVAERTLHAILPSKDASPPA